MRIIEYKSAIKNYQNVKDKKEKRRIETIIAEIKNEFKAAIGSKEINELKKLESDYYTEYQRNRLFEVELDKLKLTKIEERKKDSFQKIQKLTGKIEETKNNKIYSNAFEWRFEFPDVLNDNGDFVGFDAIIGNPPYGVSIKGSERLIITNSLGKVPDFEIYYYFINIAGKILRTNGVNSYIIPNTLLFNVFAKEYRKQLLENWAVKSILDCTQINVFEGAATVRCIITNLTKTDSTFEDIGYKPTAGIDSFEALINQDFSYTNKKSLLDNNQNWALVFKLNSEILSFIIKLKNNIPLTSFFEVSQGYIPYRKSDLIKSYGITRATEIIEKREWHNDRKLDENYKQEIWGTNIAKYQYTVPQSYIFYGKHLAGYIDLRYFNQKRLLVREITSPQIIACIITEELVNDPQIISIIPKSVVVSIETLWCILNSKFATFFHFNSSPKATKGAFPKILVDDLKNFPIPAITELQNQYLTEKYAEGVRLKLDGHDTSIIENEIDRFVYKMYDLKPDEIKLVEMS